VRGQPEANGGAFQQQHHSAPDVPLLLPMWLLYAANVLQVAPFYVPRNSLSPAAPALTCCCSCRSRAITSGSSGSSPSSAVMPRPLVSLPAMIRLMPLAATSSSLRLCLSCLLY
jgi:hypothetical protein